MKKTVLAIGALLVLSIFFSGCLEGNASEPRLLIVDKNVSDINVIKKCVGSFGLAANGSCYSFGGGGSGDLNQIDANAWFVKKSGGLMTGDLNVSTKTNTGMSIKSDKNRVCFQPNSCDYYVDWNGTDIIISWGA